MAADDETSMVQLCRAINEQWALVVALADDDAALPSEAMRLSEMKDKWKRRMNEAASACAPGHDASVPVGKSDPNGAHDLVPAGERKGARE